MDFFTGGNDIGTLAVGLIMAGALAGFAMGAVGLAGGLVLVPALTIVLTALGLGEDLRMHVAIGTALACQLPAALLAFRLQTGDAGLATVKRLGLALIAGVATGAALSGRLHGHVLTLLFAAAAIASAALLAFDKQPVRNGTLNGWRAIAFPFLFGGAATITGTGSDKTTLRLLSGGSAAPAFAVMVSAGGAIGAMLAGLNAQGLPEHSIGYVNLLAVGVIAPAMLGAALAGNYFAEALDAKRLRISLAFFAMILAAKMVWDVMA